MQQNLAPPFALLPRACLFFGAASFFLPAFLAHSAEPPAPVAPVAQPAISAALLRSTYGEFVSHVNRQRRANPAKTVLEMRAYLAEAAMTSTQISNFYNLLSSVYENDLKDNATALMVLDEGLQALRNDPERYTVLIEKVRVLIILGRHAEAEKLLQEQWPGIVERGLAPRVLPTFISILTRNNKAPLALQIARQTTAGNLETMRDGPALITALIEQLLAAGQTDEALRWGKLNFMLCVYNDRSVQIATRLLSRVWTAKGAAGNQTSEFVAALQDPAKPNPLHAVKIPDLDAAALRGRVLLTRRPEERVSLLIAAGDWKSAMLTARRLMLERPNSNQGVLQVCRVFKAHDLHIKRANAFVEYYRSNRGANPIIEFLSEIEKQATTKQ